MPFYATLRHSTPLYATLCQYTPLYATLRHYMSLYTNLHHSTPLYATIRHSKPLYDRIRHSTATIRHYTILYATLRHSTPLYATLRHSTPLYATLRHSSHPTRLYATLRHYGWSLMSHNCQSNATLCQYMPSYATLSRIVVGKVDLLICHVLYYHTLPGAICQLSNMINLLIDQRHVSSALCVIRCRHMFLFLVLIKIPSKERERELVHSDDRNSFNTQINIFEIIFMVTTRSLACRHFAASQIF